MNKLLVIYGCLCFSGSPAVEPQESTVEPVVQKSQEINSSFENNVTALHIAAEVAETSYIDISGNELINALEPNLNEIPFVEEESEVDLGFEPYDYLPEGFNPYESFLDLDAVAFIEDGSRYNLDFDTKNYLPKDFDAYTANFNVNSINYIEEEDKDLGFNPQDYLPEGFNPYVTYVNLNAIAFIEEDQIDLGFDTNKYLPEDFSPYRGLE